MKRREFLQLAKTFDPDKHDISGWFVSEKLDGTRAFWDGGISRDIATEEVPYASVTDPKTGERKKKIKPVATGLWSRYGNPIIAPDWFLNQLPACPLDGELWAGRGNFQTCRSIVSGDMADDRWKQIRFAVYSTPAPSRVFGEGEIKNWNFHRRIDGHALEWADKLFQDFLPGMYQEGADFAQELAYLREWIEPQNDCVYLHQQTQLPADNSQALEMLEKFSADVLDRGGEGVVLRDPESIWTPKRHAGILKHKPYLDDEAVVTGFVAGKIGKQGSVLGKIGALRVRWNDLEFELGSGMTFEEREFEPAYAEYARFHPGEPMLEGHQGRHFKIGDKVTFKYRELSDDGIPKEARYWRVRNED